MLFSFIFHKLFASKHKTQPRWMNTCTGCQTKTFDGEGQAVLDGTLPREEGRGMPIAKKDEAGADVGATAS